MALSVNQPYSNNYDSQRKLGLKIQNIYSNSKKLKERVIVLIEIAFEAAVPLGGRSGDGEPGEELGDRSRRR